MQSHSKMASKIGNIPDAILGEIMVSWYHFLKTPDDFINLQFIYQQINTTHLNPPPKYLLFKDIFGNNVFSLRYDDIQCQEFPIKIQIPPALLDKHTKLKVLTSFSLMCLYCHSSSFPRCMKYALFDIYLWNPLVQKYKTLPDVPLIPPRLFSSRIYWRDLAFGYVPQSDDYLVVTIVCYDGGKYDDGFDMRCCFICVYSLTTNSWKKINGEDVYGFGYIEKIDSLFEPVIISGTAFWYGNYEHGLPVFLYYDTMNNVLGKQFLPILTDHNRCTHSYIRQCGQSIVCILKEYRERHEQVQLWALEEGPMRSFNWEMKIYVNLDRIARPEFIGSRNNGELILPEVNQCHLVSYDVEKNEVSDFVQFWYRWFSHGIAKGKNNYDLEDGKLDSYDLEDRKLDITAVPFSVYPFVESLVLLDAD